LDHGDLPDDIDLELAAKLGKRHELERGGDSDAGVVHEPVKLSSDDRGGGLDLPRIRDVELDRLDAVPTERRGVLLSANATVDLPPGPRESHRACVPDPGRRARDEDGASHAA